MLCRRARIQVAEEAGFIAIVPQGYLRSWSAGACCGAAAREELDDVGYVAFTTRGRAFKTRARADCAFGTVLRDATPPRSSF